MKLSMPTVLAQLAILFGGYVMADEPPINIRYEERPAGKLVSGSSVPNRIKYQMLIEHYESLIGYNLARVVSSTDHAILANAANSFGSLKLSAPGQAQVTRFIDETISNGMQTIIPPSAVQLQEDDAEDFDYWLELECHRVTTGDYPAEVRDVSEQVARQFREGKIVPT